MVLYAVLTHCLCMQRCMCEIMMALWFSFAHSPSVTFMQWLFIMLTEQSIKLTLKHNLMWTVMHKLASLSWTAAQSVTSGEAWSSWRPLLSLWPWRTLTAWFPWRTLHCPDWHRLTGDVIQDWVVARQVAWWEEWQSKWVKRDTLIAERIAKYYFENFLSKVKT